MRETWQRLTNPAASIQPQGAYLDVGGRAARVLNVTVVRPTRSREDDYLTLEAVYVGAWEVPQAFTAEQQAGEWVLRDEDYRPHRLSDHDVEQLRRMAR